MNKAAFNLFKSLQAYCRSRDYKCEGCPYDIPDWSCKIEYIIESNDKELEELIEFAENWRNK